MCCTDNKVCYHVDNIGSDLITGIDNVPQVPTSVTGTVANYIGSMWIEKDRNGANVLCGYADVGANASINFTDSGGNNPYTSVAVEFVGGRPPVIRK